MNSSSIETDGFYSDVSDVSIIMINAAQKVSQGGFVVEVKDIGAGGYMNYLYKHDYATYWV